MMNRLPRWGRAALSVLLAAITLSAQQETATPNVGLEIPNYNTNSWQVPTNYNWNLLDKIFGGTIAIPSLTVSGTLNAPNVNISAQNVVTSLGFTPLNPANNLGDVNNRATALANLGGIGASSYQGNWNALSTYSAGNITYYNGSSYVSLISSNTGNTPSSTSASWGLLAQAGSSGGGGSGAGSAPAVWVLDSYIDLRSYGWDPNASPATNVAAWQQASAAAFNSATGIVRIPGGTYRVNATLAMSNKVQYQGSGRGDPGGINTVIQLDPSTPANTPVIQLGVPGGSDSHFGSRISNLTLDCNGVSGAIGIADGFAEEQSGGEHLIIANCGGSSLQILGADYAATNTFNGSSQNSYGYHDIEIFPGSAATPSTIPVLLSNLQEGLGLERVSVVMNQSYPVKYGIVASGNNFSLHSIHIEAAGVGGGAGILLGPYTSPMNTVGASKIQITNAVLSTGGQGPVIEIATGAPNAPTGLFLTGIQGGTGCGTVKNDGTGYCGYPDPYILGAQSNGNTIEVPFGFGDTWHLHGAIQNDDGSYFGYFDTSTAILEPKSATSPYPGFAIGITATGDMNFGMGARDGGGFGVFSNPYKGICVGNEGTGQCNGQVLQGGLADSGDSVFDGVFHDLYWNHGTTAWHSVGDGSGYVSGVFTMNPGGSASVLDPVGGVGILNATGIGNGTEFSQSTFNTYIGNYFNQYGMTGKALSVKPPFYPPANYYRLYPKTDGNWYTENSAGTETPLGTGGGGGGTSGNATSIQGTTVTGPTTAAGQILLSTSASGFPLTPTALSSVLTNGGSGICINGSGVPYPCPAERVVSGTTDTITASDCGNRVVYSNAAAVTAALVQVGVSMPAYCVVRISDEGTGGVTINGNTSTIGGAASYTIPTGGTALSPKFVDLYADSVNYRVGEHN